jgi:hypothetical protein
MLQVYVPNVLPIWDVCCKCFIWMLHILPTYVLIVSPYFNMLQRVLLPTRSDSRNHALHQMPLHHQAWSPIMEHAAGSTHVHTRCASSLPLSPRVVLCLALGYARCDPASLACSWGLSALGHAYCALPRIGGTVRALCSLSLACS